MPDGDERWALWVDTGGTFTDCIAHHPAHGSRRVKVLSSSALRARLTAVEGPTLTYDARWSVPDDFLIGGEVVALGDARGPTVRGSEGTARRLHLERPTSWPVDLVCEIRFPIEAPVLAAHLATACPPHRPLPPMQMRLATTRGTNALLERRGAPVALFVTRGFADLLRIGDQARPDLFALDVRRPPTLEHVVYEVDERLDAEGTVLRPLDLDTLAAAITDARAHGIESAAVALLHSYRDDRHERAVAAALQAAGFRHVSTSAALSPTIKILPRAETAVVNAYLAPVIERYLERIHDAVGDDSLHVLTSAGGLERAGRYLPKDSLLSGPAGGVVGAADAGALCGFSRVIAFDMGGTSTDVSRCDGRPEVRFEHRVGDARVAAPALAIETVAAGGGSICRVADGRLQVGPESAGAQPGPACYGAGGPLTITDVNLLLGRVQAERFGIPIDENAARDALDRLIGALQGEGDSPPSPETVLEGCRAITNERMADAIRRISVQRGYDPADHALVAFGGAGGQHACAVAALLGMSVVVLPPDAGLLSARGLAAARIERMARETILLPLARIGRSLPQRLARLEAAAVAAVVAEGVAAGSIAIRERRVALRLRDQESTIEVPVEGGTLAKTFRDRYREVYGYAPPRRALEVVTMRVTAAAVRDQDRRVSSDRIPAAGTSAPSGATQRTLIDGGWQDVRTVARTDLAEGDRVAGPASIHDPHASLFLEAGWTAERAPSGAIVARRTTEAGTVR